MREECGGVSIVLPIRNAEGTIIKTLDSLSIQRTQFPVEIIVINDDSSDRSVQIVESHPLSHSVPVRILDKERDGLAAAYNQGWLAARHEIIVYMHQDCFVEDPQALGCLVVPFNCSTVVASLSRCALPYSAWQEMSFWDKVAAARHVGREEQMLQGKFDAIRRSALAQVCGYDERSFLGAGEDLDMLLRLRAIGDVVKTDVSVVHAHQYSKDAKLFSLFRKQRQLGEGLGALLRKHSLAIVRGELFPIFIGHCVKAALLVMLFIPGCSLVSMVLLLALGLFYSSRALLLRDVRVIVIPFVHVLLFGTFVVSTFIGYLQGRQQFDYFARRRMS